MADSLDAEHTPLHAIPSIVSDDESDFGRQLRNCTQLPELRMVLARISKQLGFDYFALSCHIQRCHLRESNSLGEPLTLDNYPSAWKRMVAARRYFSDDPVLAAVEKSAAVFAWSEIGDLIDLTPHQNEILSAASAMGLGNGFTVPVHMPGDCTGSCSFVMRLGRSLPWEVLATAQYIGAIAFDTLRHIAAPAKSAPPRLTQRQFDCIVLVAQGKSDWDAGRLLGISDQTVHKHIEDAKRRYGVATRIQLVVRALFDNRLTFGDVLAARPS